jgi:hypothetical protein
MPRKVTTGGPIYLSNNDFGDLESYTPQPQITDFGLAQRGDGPSLRFPIQPRPYHAPEVFLGTDWSYSADI